MFERHEEFLISVHPEIHCNISLQRSSIHLPTKVKKHLYSNQYCIGTTFELKTYSRRSKVDSIVVEFYYSELYPQIHQYKITFVKPFQLFDFQT